MHPSVDPDSFGFLINDLARLFRSEFDRRVSRSGVGLTAGEARTLVYVARLEGERQNVIAERLNIEAMSLSGMIDRLEARGLVARETDPTDRRAKCVRLTEKSGETLARVTALARTISQEASQGINPADWAALAVTLKAARTNIAAAKSASVTESDAA